MIKVLSPVWMVFCLLCFVLPASADAVKKSAPPVPAAHPPFQPGEKLTYEISWSNLINAGIAVMEVTDGEKAGGSGGYQLASSARSSRMLSKFYVVSDTIASVFDVENERPLSFILDQSHGKRKKKSEMRFDYKEGAVSVLTDGQWNTYPIPADVQDPLSVLYYVRMKKEFIVGKPIVVNVHEDGRNWEVEVQVLGREKVKTPLGEFNTIKLRTYPKYDGVFQNKGEIFFWITDDARKIPVLMKSTISIGSIVSTLVGLQSGDLKK